VFGREEIGSQKYRREEWTELELRNERNIDVCFKNNRREEIKV